MGRKRCYRIDNIRALLIMGVVFGHTMRYNSFPLRNVLYCALYSFHMPAFVFLSGLCFRKGIRIFRPLILVYLLLQIPFCFLDAILNGQTVSLQFSTPVWILWYLPALAMWRLLANSLPLDRKGGFWALLISLAAALLIGFDETIEYYFTLSRMICFFPFFLAGAWIRNTCWPSLETFFNALPPPEEFFCFFPRSSHSFCC